MSPVRQGHWYLPNGMLVVEDDISAFHVSRDGNGKVSLNHHSDVTSPTGKFCCKVADADGIEQTLCVVIGMIQELHNIFNMD